jgi:hypothetical protein
MLGCRKNTPTIRFSQIAGMLLQMFIVSTALRMVGFKRVYRHLARSGRPHKVSGCSHPMTEARKTAEVLQRINREYSLLGNSCLTESLVLWRILIKRGIDARFRIGVRTLTGVFESHAWVECEGQVLNDTAHVKSIFTPIDLYPLTESRGGHERLGGHRQ